MDGLNTSDKVEAVKSLAKRDYSIKRACEALNISRSTYYYQLKQEQSKDNTKSSVYSGIPAFDENGNKISEQEMIELVKEYTAKYPYYGYRMITNYIRSKEGVIVNHKRIYRIMQELDLLQEKNRPKPEEYNRSQQHEIDGPNQMWQLDMVQWYLDSTGNWVYMFDIMDVYTREIVGYHMSLRCRTDEALAALEEALENRDVDDVILRTDNGVQFRSRDFQNYLNKLDKEDDIKVNHERITVDTPKENAYIESFHGTLKKEEIYYTPTYENILDCKSSVDQYIEEYNQERLHSSLDYLTPREFVKQIESGIIINEKMVA